MQICDDNLFDVETTRPIVDVELYSIHGDRCATVRISPQLVWPTAILFEDKCFYRRDDGKYYAVFTVVATR